MKLHFVRSIRGLQNFLAIPIMNPLAGFMINYAMLHYSDLKYAQYKTLCMHYTVTYHHDTSCFLIA